MDGQRFDALATALAGDASRRSVVGGVFGGALAAVLGAVGLGGLAVEDAEAKKQKGCRAKCNKKKSKAAKRACRKRCTKKPPTPPTAAPQVISTNLLGVALGLSCAVPNDCLTGLVCNGGTCSACGTICPTGSTTTCCVLGICQVIGGLDVCVLS